MENYTWMSLYDMFFSANFVMIVLLNQPINDRYIQDKFRTRSITF